MTAESFYSNSQSVLGVAFEATRNTWVTPAYWIPVTSPALVVNLTEVLDTALRGSMVTNYDQVPTVRHDEYSFTTYCYLDTLPVFLRAILGSSDTVTGSAAPYSHEIGLGNAIGAGNQPPSIALTDYDGYLYRKLAGGQMDELTIKFTATGLIELTCKFLCMPFTTSSDAISTAFTTARAEPSWSCTASQGGTTIDRITDGTISLKRNVKAIPTVGQQAPKLLWAGPLDISGSATWLKKDDTELTLYTGGTSTSWSLVFADAATSSHTFTIQMSTLQLANAKDTRSGDGLIETTADLIPLPSTTDAASAVDGGGVSPILTTVANATASYS